MEIVLIIPFKDAAPYLERCLKSIAGPFDEVIMIDDGSTDGGADIVDNFDNHGFPIYLKKLDGSHGVGYARNRGIERALEIGADYITFLDADDELAPGAYFHIQAAICEAPEAEIIQLNHYRDNRTIRFFNPRGTYRLNRLPGLYVLVWNKVIKAELLRSVRFNENLRHGEDELFILECLKTARRIYCSEQIGVIHHADNPNSLSRQTSFYDLIDEQQALIDFLRDNAPFYPEEAERFELCEAIRQRQADLWTNAVYRRVIGGAP